MPFSVKSTCWTRRSLRDSVENSQVCLPTSLRPAVSLRSSLRVARKRVAEGRFARGVKTKVLASAHFPSPRMEGEKATGCRSAGRALPTRFFGAAGWENMIFTGARPLTVPEGENERTENSSAGAPSASPVPPARRSSARNIRISFFMHILLFHCSTSCRLFVIGARKHLHYTLFHRWMPHPEIPRPGGPEGWDVPFPRGGAGRRKGAKTRGRRRGKRKSFFLPEKSFSPLPTEKSPL